MLHRSFAWLLLALVLFGLTTIGAQSSFAQTPTFTYQGNLTESGAPANGNYDLQFKLFDTAMVGTGTQQGDTLTRNPVSVSTGVFTVTLDFGANVFDGSTRYLEIGVRPAGSAATYTVLSPRQPITSTPYAIQTLNAQQLGGVPASSYTKLNASGNLGLGITAPTHRLTIGGGPGWTTDNWGGAIGLENAAALGWSANTSGLRFGMGRTNAGFMMFRTTSELGTTTSPPTYDFRIDNAGNVGIGAVDLNSNLTFGRLNVFGGASDGIYSESSTGIGITGSGNNSFGVRGTSNSASGIFGLSVNSYGVSGDSTGLAGVFGRGLNSNGTGVWGEANSGLSSIGVYGKSNEGVGVKGISQSNQGVNGESSGLGAAGVLGKSTHANGFGVYGRNLNGGMAMFADGNAGQTRNKGGWVKAMALIDRSTILRCYNAITGSDAGNCGFSASYNSFTFTSTINFGFQVDDRFVLLTPLSPGGIETEINRALYIPFIGGNNVDVHSEIVDCSGSGFCSANNMKFMIFIF